MVKRLLGFVVLAMALVGCGNGNSIRFGGDGGTAQISGVVVKGAVSGATVTAFALDAKTLAQGRTLGSASTSPTGAYTIAMPAYSGPVLLVATGGGYKEEATYFSVQLNGSSLTGILPNYVPGSGVVFNLTPVSSWAVALDTYYVKKGQVLATVDATNWTHLNADFGPFDWRTTTPADVTLRVDGGTGLTDSPEVEAGLFLAGISQEAQAIAGLAGVTFGLGFSTMDLTNALSADVGADGYFDGYGTGGQQVILPLNIASLLDGGNSGATPLDGNALRSTLAFQLNAWLGSPWNATLLTPSDVLSFLSGLSTISDSYLFRTGGAGFDTTPPAVAVVDAGYYTNQTDAGFYVTANDGVQGSGVANVYASWGTTTYTGAFVDGGVWAFNVPLGVGGVQGPAPFTIWAKDKAGNSGLSKGAPYEAQYAFFFDNSTPALSWTTYQTYYNETFMQLTRGIGAGGPGTGVPFVPAQFTFTTGKSDISNVLSPPATVYKTSATLSWGAWDGGSPDIPTLEGTNPNNIPVIQGQVAFGSAATEAPIAAVTYNATVGGSDAGFGTLFPSAKSLSGYRLFDLPLSEELFGILKTTSTSPVTLNLSFVAQDAAGNVSIAQPKTVTYHVIAPPVVVAQNTNYSTSGDALSIYSSRSISSNGGYVGFWLPQTGQDITRAALFEVFNPWPVSVPVGIVAPVSWSLSENWGFWAQEANPYADVNAEYPSPACGSAPGSLDFCLDYYFPGVTGWTGAITGGPLGHGSWTMDGFSYSNPGVFVIAPHTYYTAQNYPCPLNSGWTSGSPAGYLQSYPQHVWGSSSQWQCVSGPPTGPSGTYSGSTIFNVASGTAGSVVAYPIFGGSEFPPGPVPAAAGGTNGAMHIYVGRPWAPTRPSSYPLTWEQPFSGAASHYWAQVTDTWSPSGPSLASGACWQTEAGYTQWCSPTYGVGLPLTRTGYFLNGSTDSFSSGSLTVTAQGLESNVMPSVTWSATANH
jgi:hypothetical protein